MAEENRVVLYGMWASPFAKRIELALKIKGIPFEYVEEDLQNKSPELLKFNPVYKKVPVLVHNGRPICESSVIFEYIEEVWTNSGPSLLPQDPYKRAQVRFWADFVQKQLFEGMFLLMKTEGEAQEKGIKEVKEKLRVLEEQGLKSLLGEESSPFVNGDELGYLDIVMLTVLGMYKTHEEFSGVKIVEEEKIPTVFSWLNRLIDHPIAKEVGPPKEKVLGFLHFIRQKLLHSQAAA
ncbi:glutathione S-transferase U9-like [Benincasa hispida]|uniref:glutathione S-transferase U9-like n=1 Tax=Benincasa hispida TaxID=102211 RepID=UPI0019006FD8|nr:glutathione S-transferase U9-like [Benincasa hispida]